MNAIAEERRCERGFPPGRCGDGSFKSGDEEWAIRYATSRSSAGCAPVVSPDDRASTAPDRRAERARPRHSAISSSSPPASPLPVRVPIPPIMPGVEAANRARHLGLAMMALQFFSSGRFRGPQRAYRASTRPSLFTPLGGADPLDRRDPCTPCSTRSPTFLADPARGFDPARHDVFLGRARSHRG